MSIIKKAFYLLIFLLSFLGYVSADLVQAPIENRNPIELDIQSLVYNEKDSEVVLNIDITNNTDKFISNLKGTLSVFKGDKVNENGYMFEYMELSYAIGGNIESLSPKESINKNLSYKLPNTLESGNYFFQYAITDREIRYTGSDYYNEAIKISGNGGYIGTVEAYIKSIEVKDAKIPLMQGELYASNKTITLVIPSDNNDNLKKTLEKEKIFVKASVLPVTTNKDIMKNSEKKEIVFDKNGNFEYTITPWENMPTGSMTIELNVLNEKNIEVSNSIMARWFRGEELSRIKNIETEKESYKKGENLDIVVEGAFLNFEEDHLLGIKIEIYDINDKIHTFNQDYTFKKENDEILIFDFSDQKVEDDIIIQDIKVIIEETKVNKGTENQETDNDGSEKQETKYKEIKDEYTINVIKKAEQGIIGKQGEQDGGNANSTNKEEKNATDKEKTSILKIIIIPLIFIIFIILSIFMMKKKKGINSLIIFFSLMILGVFFNYDSVSATVCGPISSIHGGSNTTTVWGTRSSYTVGDLGDDPTIRVNQATANVICDGCLNGVAGKIGLEVVKSNGTAVGKTCSRISDEGHKWSWKPVGDSNRYIPQVFNLSYTLPDNGSYKYRIVLETAVGCHCGADTWTSGRINVHYNIPISGDCGGTHGTRTENVVTACDKGAKTSKPTLATSRYRWECGGENGGNSVSCWSDKKIDGVCGQTHGTITSSPEAKCALGTRISFSHSPFGTYTRYCKGVNYGDTSGKCRTKRKIDSNCGSANDSYKDSSPTTGLCGWQNQASPVTLNSTTNIWNRTCIGLNNTSYETCKAYKNIDGVCENKNPDNTESTTPDNPLYCDTGDKININTGAGIVGFLGKYKYITWDCEKIHQGDDVNCKSCTYISSRTEGEWSPCIVGDWNENGTASCFQTRTNTANYKTIYGSSSSIESCQLDADEPFPSRTLDVSLNLTPNNSCETTSTIANNNETCDIGFDINFKDLNTNHSLNEAEITGLTILGLSGDPVTGVDYTDIPTNQIIGGTNDGLIEPGDIPEIKISSDYKLNIFGFKSLVPFEKTNGTLSFYLDNILIKFNNNIKIGFKKPYIGQIVMSGAIDEISLGAAQTAILEVIGTGSINIPNKNIDEYDTSLRLLGNNENNILDYDLYKTGFQDNIPPYISTTINFLGAGTIGEIGMETHPEIIYQLSGEDITYYLTNSYNPDTIPSNAPWITKAPGGFLGVKIVGLSQLDGKLTSSGLDENSSDITTVEVRTAIKKDAELLIRDMVSDVPKNGVYYLDSSSNKVNENGNIKISELTLDGIETLIVKDVNLIIDEDIDLKDEYGNNYLAGIIALGNYYDRPDLSNVFVSPNVRYINALIYAEGGFISIRGTQVSTIGYTDTSARTEYLRNQLVLKGSLVTRNTVGGALLVGGNYMLPGGATTDIFNESMKYDLNYIRRGTGNPVSTTNLGYTNPFVIVYDSRRKNSPPPGF